MLYFLTGALSYATGIGAIQNNKYLKLAILLIILLGYFTLTVKRNQIHFIDCSDRFCSWYLVASISLVWLRDPLCRFRRSTTNDTVYENIDS